MPELGEPMTEPEALDPIDQTHDRATGCTRRRHRSVRAVAWILAGLVAALLLAAPVGGLWGWRALNGSLPVVDGTVALPGLTAPVTLTRDAVGVPTIAGGTQLDVARATGFIHAKERFFQMDLQRRQAAGELVGRSALPLDRASRIHRGCRVSRHEAECGRVTRDPDHLARKDREIH